MQLRSVLSAMIGRSTLESIERRAVGIASKISPWLSGVPRYPQHNFQSLIREGYLKNPLISAGMRQIISVFAQASLRVQDIETKEPVKNHPLTLLIRRPDDLAGAYEYWLWEWTLTDLFLTGNCFWELVRSRTGKIVQILRMEPSRTAIVPDAKTFIGHYLYEVDGVWWKVPRENVLHWKFFHPLDRWFGLSPLLAALRAIATDNEAMDFLNVTLVNLAVPPLAVQSSQPITGPDAKEFKRQWKDMYGRRRRGEIAVLQKGMEIKTIGFSLEDLAFPELQAGLETRILMTIGGAALVYMVGAKAGMDRATFANFGEARESLTTDIVQPLWSRMDDLITQQLLPNWDGSRNTEAVFDTTNVVAMEERRIRRIVAASQGFTAGVLLRNEARRISGERALLTDVVQRAINVDQLEVTKDGKVIEPDPPKELPPSSNPPSNSNKPADPTAEQDDPADEEDLGKTTGG